MSKWTFDGVTLSRNPIVWEPVHEYTHTEEIVFDDGRIGHLTKEVPFRSVTIRCAFDKLNASETSFLRGLHDKEFWIVTDVPGEEWRVRITSFNPVWNMRGPTDTNRRFDVAMDLRCTWPFARNAVVNGPTLRNPNVSWDILVEGNADTWNLLVEITGSVTNPKIVNVTTGKYSQYLGTLSNETLAINMLDRWATVGATDKTHLVTGFFPLKKGTNTIRYEGSASATVTLTWYPCNL